MKLAQQGEAGVGGTHVVSQPVGDATETPRPLAPALHFPRLEGLTWSQSQWVDPTETPKPSTPALHFPLSRGPAVTRKSPGWVDVHVSRETASTHLDVLFYVCRGLSFTFLVPP